METLGKRLQEIEKSERDAAAKKQKKDENDLLEKIQKVTPGRLLEMAAKQTRDLGYDEILLFANHSHAPVLDEGTEFDWWLSGPEFQIVHQHLSEVCKNAGLDCYINTYVWPRWRVNGGIYARMPEQLRSSLIIRRLQERMERAIKKGTTPDCEVMLLIPEKDFEPDESKLHGAFWTDRPDRNKMIRSRLRGAALQVFDYCVLQDLYCQLRHIGNRGSDSDERSLLQVSLPPLK